MSENKEKNIKCSKCGCREGVTFKGQNNTRLCGGVWYNKGCGRNVCFICGKKETRTEWRKEEDCCGNEVMRERKVEMFSQEERDESDPHNPEMTLKVHYCDEHKEEAQKSPLKWTDTDNKRIEKEKEQKKLEIEEKLGSQKGLFYCYEPFPRSVEWKQVESIKYGCVYFWGQENGQNFFLMVPDTHPVLNDLKYTEKVKSGYDGREIEYTRYNLKKQFYTIEGVENLPLEATDNRYEGNDPYAKAYRFSKFVGLNDEIKLIPVDSQSKPEKNKPAENKSPNSQNKNNFDTSLKLNTETLLEYFQKNKIQSIELELKGDESLIIIECNGSSTTTNLQTLLTNSPELKGIDKYLEKKSDKKVSRSELEEGNNSNTNSITKPKNNVVLWISCGIGGSLVIVLIIGLLIRRKKCVKKG